MGHQSQASDNEILAAITRSATSQIVFDIDKAVKITHVAKQTIKNRLAALRREHGLNFKATSGVNKSAPRQGKSRSSPAKQLKGKERGKRKNGDHDSGIDGNGALDADGPGQSDVSAEL